MLDRLFPKQFDNAYRGHWIAIAIFILVVLLKATQGVNSMFLTVQTMKNADGIPLDNYSGAAAETMIAMFAALGFYLLILPVISAVALIRYRTMIPFLYLMLLLTQVGVRILFGAHPIPKPAVTAIGYAGHPIGYYVGISILALTVIGFALSLVRRKDAVRE